MLWQTGYLTISEVLESPGLREYNLTLPNHEVRVSLNHALLMDYLPESSNVAEGVRDLREMLRGGDLEAVEGYFKGLFTSIPYEWHKNNQIAKYEGYYASVFYSHLAAMGLEMSGEEVSRAGRCDLVVRYGNRVYVFEFKVIEGEEGTGESLEQIKKKGYAEKYIGSGREVYLIGIEFSKLKRQIVGFYSERE